MEAAIEKDVFDYLVYQLLRYNQFYPSVCTSKLIEGYTEALFRTHFFSKQDMWRFRSILEHIREVSKSGGVLSEPEIVNMLTFLRVSSPTKSDEQEKTIET